MNEIKVNEMKWFGVFVVLCFVHNLNAIPFPLQGFGTGDHTTGSEWPIHENAGNLQYSS